MINRPEFDVPLNWADRVMELASWLALMLLWALAVGSYTHLPDIIPVHFNLYGQADGFGPKYLLWILPASGTGLFALMGHLNKKPHLFNYPKPVTPDNALRQYTLATRLMRYLKLAVLLVFVLIVLFVVLPALGQNLSLPTWMLPLTLGFILGPVVIYLFRSLSA